MSTVSVSDGAFSDGVSFRFQFLKHVKHRHIVNWNEIFEDNRYCWISKEYIHGGTLMESLTFPLHEVNARKYINQLLIATKYLHSLNIVHRNLKACNLMLSDADPLDPDLKLVDFEFSTKVDDHATYKDCPGNVHYVEFSLQTSCTDCDLFGR